MLDRFVVFVAMAAAWLASPTAKPDDEVTTMTGWFSDAQCAAPRVANGTIGPNNPECVKKCLDKGATAVFVSEQARAMFEVKDYVPVKDDVGYHIELTGTVDDRRTSISVKSVKRLEYTGAMCALPRKKG